MSDGVLDGISLVSVPVLGEPLLAVAADGVVMPVSEGSIEFARSEEWGRFSGLEEFNSIFYTALQSAGINMKRARDEVGVLKAHRLPFGMTPIQVYVAYGFEHGVIGRHGRFNPGKLNGTDWEVKLIEARARRAVGPGARKFDVGEWDRIETDALAACTGLPDQVDIAVEFRWIRSNLHQTPYFKNAPSQGAIKDWLTIMGKDVSPMLREFTSVAWSKRLSPGDRKSKSKSAFVEDEVGEAGDEAAARDAAAFKRLFGDMKEKP